MMASFLYLASPIAKVDRGRLRDPCCFQLLQMAGFKKPIRPGQADAVAKIDA